MPCSIYLPGCSDGMRYCIYACTLSHPCIHTWILLLNIKGNTNVQQHIKVLEMKKRKKELRSSVVEKFSFEFNRGVWSQQSFLWRPDLRIVGGFFPAQSLGSILQLWFLKVKAARRADAVLSLLTSLPHIFCSPCFPSRKARQPASRVYHHSPKSLMLYNYARLRIACSQAIRILSTPGFLARIRLPWAGFLTPRLHCQVELMLTARVKKFEVDSGSGNSVRGLSAVYKF